MRECVNMRVLASHLLTILVPQLWAKPPFKCGTRYQHRAFWGVCPLLPFRPLSGPLEKCSSVPHQSRRPCLGGSQLTPDCSPGTVMAFTSLGLTHGAGERRPHVCRLPFKTKHPNRETTSPPPTTTPNSVYWCQTLMC